MRVLWLMLTCFIAFAGAPSFAQDTPADDGKEPLPVNPFGQVTTDTWVTYTGTRTHKGKELHARVTWRVYGVSGKDVDLLIVEENDEKGLGRTRGVTTDAGPTLHVLLDDSYLDFARMGFSELKVDSEKHKLRDREFDCKKVTFQSRPDKSGKSYAGTLWLCAEVKGAGIVELRYGATDGHGEQLALELA